MNIGWGKCMPIDLKIQQGLPFVFTNLPNLIGILSPIVILKKKQIQRSRTIHPISEKNWDMCVCVNILLDSKVWHWKLWTYVIFTFAVKSYFYYLQNISEVVNSLKLQ